MTTDKRMPRFDEEMRYDSVKIYRQAKRAHESAKKQAKYRKAALAGGGAKERARRKS